MSLARESGRTRPGNGPLIGIGVAVVAALGLGGWALTRGHTEAATVVRRDIVASVPIQGDVIAPPDAQASIPAPYRAPVAKVYTSVGQNVRRGDTLVELSLPNVQDLYRQARENVRSAETAYANARKQYQTAVDAARKNLDTARAAERSARQASAPPTAATTAANTPDTPGASVSPGNTGAADLGAASQSRIQAEAALAQAQAEMTSALQPYQQQLDAARAAFKDAQSGRKQALVRAPIAGTVLALNAQPGSEVGQDQKVPVALIVDLEKLMVQGPLANSQATFVKEGMPAVITVAGVPGERFDGRVHAVTTQVTGGLLKRTQYVALVHVVQKKGQVKPGMKATASINAGEVKNVLAVPADAVRTDSSGRFTVQVNHGGQWQDQIVEVGLSDGKYTEIKSGLQEGENIRVKAKLI